MICPIRQANAIVYFRALQSEGRFEPIVGTKHFLFSPCTCGRRSQAELLPNGIPQPMQEHSLGEVISEYRGEFGYLCRRFLGEVSS